MPLDLTLEIRRSNDAAGVRDSVIMIGQESSAIAQ
jgi:hypothetical protein